MSSNYIKKISLLVFCKKISGLNIGSFANLGQLGRDTFLIFNAEAEI